MMPKQNRAGAPLKPEPRHHPLRCTDTGRSVERQRGCAAWHRTRACPTSVGAPVDGRSRGRSCRPPTRAESPRRLRGRASTRRECRAARRNRSRGRTQQRRRKRSPTLPRTRTSTWVVDSQTCQAGGGAAATESDFEFSYCHSTVHLNRSATPHTVASTTITTAPHINATTRTTPITALSSVGPFRDHLLHRHLGRFSLRALRRSLPVALNRASSASPSLHSPSLLNISSSSSVSGSRLPFTPAAGDSYRYGTISVRRIESESATGHTPVSFH
jgi:hypothetical protein